MHENAIDMIEAELRKVRYEKDEAEQEAKRHLLKHEGAVERRDILARLEEDYMQAILALLSEEEEE